MTHVSIIGSGIMGVMLAYRLSQAGLRVTIYERGDTYGGLATYIHYKNWRIDKFYHTILSSDISMQTLIRESGVSDKLHFTSTKQGFYDNGQVYPFSTPIDLLVYPPLNIFQRFKLGLQILHAQTEVDWRKMDIVRVEDWLLKVSGEGVYEKVWKPLLRAKFDNIDISTIPATYIWSRLRRMMSTRQGVTSKEMMCYLEGGYYTLIEGLVARCQAQGVIFRLNTGIDEIVVEDGSAVGVRVDGEIEFCDVVISTLGSPLLAKILPEADADFRARLSEQKYLGILCPLLILKQRLTPYYVLNITDESIPFTAVVETTNLIDPQYIGSYHLVYLPKYLSPGSELAHWDDERVQSEWMTHFTRMFPHFDTTQIEAFLVHRAPYVEALHPLGINNAIPSIITPIQRLYMSNSVMIYPELNNGESVTRLATRTAELVLSNLCTTQPAL